MREKRAAAWPCALALIGGLILMGTGSVAVASQDPYLRWRTIATRHFRVTYHQGLEPIARRTAAIAEDAYDRVGRVLGHRPSEVVEIVLTDGVDYANGFASVVPYNHILLFVHPPADLSELSDYDDWLTMLVVHEYTHVVHMDTIGGVARAINTIFGKVYGPNQVQPAWVLEGLAAFEESRETSGGRARSTFFDMFLRMDVLEGRLLAIDEVSNGPLRWPRGSTPYLYGSRFVQFIADRYGVASLRRISHAYGRQAVPYALNRVARRATGRTFEALYDDWRAAMTARFTEQGRAVRERGLTAFRALTDGLEDVQHPRFSPDGGSIVFFSAPPDDHSALRRIPFDGRAQGPVPRAETLRWVSGPSTSAFSPDGRALLFTAIQMHRNLYPFYDVYRLDLGTRDVRRVTRGARTSEIALSPDGRTLAYTQTRRGTTHLGIAGTDFQGARIVRPSAPIEQAFTPRFAPDGRTIAYSAIRGGARDVFLYDRQSGAERAVTHDRAIDQNPVFSRDGRTLYFVSDRSGIANVYAFDLASRELAQVTNVLGGAFQPDVSPDGRWLVYVGYGARGFDLHVMPLDPARFRADVGPSYARPAVRAPRPTRISPSTPYNPLRTLRPRSWLLGLSQGGLGSALTAATAGRDAVGQHAFDAIVGVNLPSGEIEYQVDYAFGALVPDLSLSQGRRLSVRHWWLDGEAQPYVEESWSASAALSYALRSTTHAHYLSLRYAVQYLHPYPDAPIDPDRLDPSGQLPYYPLRGWFAGIRAGWFYSNAQYYANGISAEEGRSVGLRVALYHPMFGSQFRVYEFEWSWTEYVRMPFVRHHVLALRYAGGLSGGDFGRRGVFWVGGMPQVDLLGDLIGRQNWGGTWLRGYDFAARVGYHYHLVQAEYRFPIASIHRGVVTLPVAIRRIWGAVYADYGNAFVGPLKLSDFLLGAGAEIFVELQTGYFVVSTFRIGLARGLSEGGYWQPYVILSTPF